MLGPRIGSFELIVSPHIEKHQSNQFDKEKVKKIEVTITVELKVLNLNFLNFCFDKIDSLENRLVMFVASLYMG